MEKLYNDDVNISVLTAQMEILQLLLKAGDYFCFDDITGGPDVLCDLHT